jgi:hypothetical protein
MHLSTQSPRHLTSVHRPKGFSPPSANKSSPAYHQLSYIHYLQIMADNIYHKQQHIKAGRKVNLLLYVSPRKSSRFGIEWNASAIGLCW